MKKKLIWGGTILALAILALPPAYYWYEIRTARTSTRDLVSAAYRKYGRDVSLEAISQGRKNILLAIEDPRFYEHRGVDLQTPGAGMTTITQGLAKLLYFPDGFKPGIAKIRQTLIAQYALDAIVPKDAQLELYLNITYFGSVDDKPVHGLEQAAQTYFTKSHLDLTNDEFISLIGMTIAPNRMKPGTPAGVERLRRIKRYLAEEIRPQSVLDVAYTGKPHGTFLEETLMIFLRYLTDASPQP